MRLIVLRPEPGAARTAGRAEKLDFDVRCVPLFTAVPLAWDAPAPGDFGALLVTSAQTVRLAGPGIHAYRDLPAYAVGPATAAALRKAGFATIMTGETDGSAIAARIARDGHRSVLHLAGEAVASIAAGPLSIRRVVVYAMVETQAALDVAIEPGAVLLVHSARAGQRIAMLIPLPARAALHIVAISPAALAAAGGGWASAGTADRPNDDDMLALAADLCK